MTFQFTPQGLDKDNMKDLPVSPLFCLVLSSLGNPFWVIRVKRVGDLYGRRRKKE